MIQPIGDPREHNKALRRTPTSGAGEIERYAELLISAETVEKGIN